MPFNPMRQYLRCVGLLGAIGLSSCSGIIPPLNDQPLPPSPLPACEQASVLITNLTEDTYHRQYQLPNGIHCAEVNS